MTKGIVICHARLAFELTNTLKKLFGKVDGLYSFSNDQLALEEITKRILDFIKKEKINNLIVMVDLQGGNCWKIGKMLCREYPSTKLLSGVNIPMLVSFVNKREKLPVHELGRILEKDANRGIVLE